MFLLTRCSAFVLSLLPRKPAFKLVPGSHELYGSLMMMFFLTTVNFPKILPVVSVRCCNMLKSVPFERSKHTSTCAAV